MPRTKTPPFSMDKPIVSFLDVVQKRILKGQRLRTIVLQHYDSLLSLAVNIKSQIATEQQQGMASVIEVIGAIITRALFATHGAFVVMMVVSLYPGNEYWYLLIGLCLLGVEMCFTLFIRRGREYKQ